MEQPPCPRQCCRQGPERETDNKCFEHDRLHVFEFNYNLTGHHIRTYRSVQPVLRLKWIDNQGSGKSILTQRRRDAETQRRRDVLYCKIEFLLCALCVKPVFGFLNLKEPGFFSW
jgi:hypothetical protein